MRIALYALCLILSYFSAIIKAKAETRERKANRCRTEAQEQEKTPRDGAQRTSRGADKINRTIRPIGHIHTLFPEKFGLPRQSSLKEELLGALTLDGEYARAEALHGIEDFSHLWLIWDFSEAHTDSWSPTVNARRASAETAGWEYLPPARPTVRIRSDCPAYGCCVSAAEENVMNRAALSSQAVTAHPVR